MIKNDYRYDLYRYINNKYDISHEDLDKIVPYAIKNDYEDSILTKRIAEVPNLSSNHISHIIASGHLGAIKKMIDSQSKSNFTKQHLDDMIDIKDKEISNKLAEYPY